MQTTDPSDSFHVVSRIIAGFVSEKSRVLDVGCGTGQLALYLRTHKACYVAGIELSPDRAKLAKKRCDELIVGNVEEITELPCPVGSFDFLIFADVLEHLPNSGRVIVNLARYLSADGIVIASIPNVANWTLRLKLLFGKWQYRERGLLDKTHIRFYTRRTGQALLQESGLKVVGLTCTSGNSFIDRTMPLKNPANFWKGLLGCNLIFRARRTTS